jgi:predicted nucleic acid-binding protein
VSGAPPGGVVVVDTDVVSFIFKEDTRGALYRPHLDGQIAVIAAQTRAELEWWALKRNWGARRRDRLREELRNYVLAPFSEAVCLRWAQVMNNAQRTGRPISVGDAWIAATALAYAVPLITNNRDDFAGVTGLTLISEMRP